nr:carbohydrate ABC transporter permease [Aminobacter lissarensis]
MTDLMLTILRKIAFACAVVLLVSPAILFFFWMLSLSFKNEVDNMAFPPVFIPNPPTLANFTTVFENNDFLQYFINSLIVTGGAVGIGLAVGIPAGYGIARSRSAKYAVLILLARMTPALSFLIPLYIVFSSLALVGTVWALIISHLVITIPIIVWVMMGYFEGLPSELEDAALVDGCSPWQSFIHIAVPLAKPGIVIAGILSFIFSWNNFVFSVVLGGRHARTLPSAVYNSMSFEQVSWGPLAASALLVTLPILVITILAQRQIVAGLSAGGLKD